MTHMRDDIKLVAFTALTCIALLVGLVGYTEWGQKQACTAAWAKTGYDYRWSFWNECEVLVHGKWVDQETVFEAAR